MPSLKSIAHQFLRSVGYEVSRYDPEANPMRRLVRMLTAHHIDLVFDVGANTGQFALALRRHGYAGQIVSIEPLTAAWEQLASNSATDPHWDVIPRTAVGESEGEATINISGNSQSSSILGMLDQHASAAPESRYIATELTPVRTLDSIAAPYLAGQPGIFLKIDTQGFEDRVLAGATDVLARCHGVQLELSLTPLYTGQRLYQDLLDELQHSGFRLWDLAPVFSDPVTGRMLQLDATLFHCEADA